MKVYEWASAEIFETACPHFKMRFDVGHHDLPDHVQRDFSTLAFIHEGVGKKKVGQQVYELQARSVYVIRPNVPHAYIETAGLKLSNVCYTEDLWKVLPSALQALPGFIALFVIEPIFRQTRHHPARLILSREEFDTCLSTLESILPLDSRQPGEVLMASSRVTDLFASLSTAYEKQHGTETSHHLPLKVARLTFWIEQHIGRSFGLEEMASECDVSLRTLNRLFVEVFHQTPKEFITRRRLEKARRLLESSDAPIAEIARRCGYADGNYFARQFRRHVGCQPREYRKEAT